MRSFLTIKTAIEANVDKLIEKIINNERSD